MIKNTLSKNFGQQIEKRQKTKAEISPKCGKLSPRVKPPIECRGISWMGGGRPRLPNIAHFAFLAFTHSHLYIYLWTKTKYRQTQGDTHKHGQMYSFAGIAWIPQTHSQIAQHATFASSWKFLILMKTFQHILDKRGVKLTFFPTFGQIPKKGPLLAFPNLIGVTDRSWWWLWYYGKCQGLGFQGCVCIEIENWAILWVSDDDEAMDPIWDKLNNQVWKTVRDGANLKPHVLKSKVIHICPIL